MSKLGKVGLKLANQLGEYFESQDLELTPHERALITELCLTVDRLDLCGRMIAVSPIEYGENGQRVKDWMAEERAQRLTLARLIRAANLTTEIVDEYANNAKPYGDGSRRKQKKA